MPSAEPGMHSPQSACAASPATPTWTKSRFRRIGISGPERGFEKRQDHGPARDLSEPEHPRCGSPVAAAPASSGG
jgi:hypothetical protein